MSHLEILPAVNERTPGDDLIFRFLDIRNRLRWLMAMGGERVFLYKRRVTGKVCSNFDVVRRQHRVDLVDDCYGTNFVGGYYGPFDITVSLSTVAPQRIKIYEQGGLRREFISTCWALWEPLLSNKDFIVRRNNQRLWITNIQQSKWHHHILRQLFSFEEIERNNPLYKFPITGF